MANTEKLPPSVIMIIWFYRQKKWTLIVHQAAFCGVKTWKVTLLQNWIQRPSENRRNVDGNLYRLFYEPVSQHSTTNVSELVWCKTNSRVDLHEELECC